MKLPYQPFLLRVLHGLTGICAIAAILTAYWTYDTYDGRFGRFGLPQFQEIEGIHGTFGLYTLLIFPAFVLYAFRRGQKRLLQADSLKHLGEVGQPIWWYTLHRLTNTLALLALTFALFSGKMMNETWLPKGELNHLWYSLHLIAWVVMVVCLALHLLISVKVGGAPLLLSMLTWKFKAKESPALWWKQIAEWWAKGRWANLVEGVRSLKLLEAFILLSILGAWAIALVKEL